MFETTLSSRMQMALRRLTGKGYLTEDDIVETLKEIRRALLEADVHLSVIKKFTEQIQTQALGEKIIKGLNPAQQVIKIVTDTLTKTLGDQTAYVSYQPSGLTVMMLIGLQGSGKTTSIVKLAKTIRDSENKKVLLVAADIYRPAAIEQLKILGQSINVEVFEKGQINVDIIIKEALLYAKKHEVDVMLIDTAGRLSIDESLLDELKRIKKMTSPTEILLTIDAMTGQDAAQTAKNFHDAIHATGVLLTKLDGDTRGGAALSVSSVANIPIKFQATGEKIETLEVFHPDRMASRILGMGDVMSLVEKASEAVSEDDAKDLISKIQNNTFNYQDLKKQFKMIQRMGSIQKVVGLIPGLGKQASQVDDAPLKEMSVIIDSMTLQERKNPSLIDQSSKRRERLAKGSGLSVAAVNRLRDAFNKQKMMMKQMMSMDPSDMNTFKPHHIQQPKIKKGKGKHKGRFKY
jgi:signal recognition particle subunit SRP54